VPRIRIPTRRVDPRLGQVTESPYLPSEGAGLAERAGVGVGGALLGVGRRLGNEADRLRREQERDRLEAKYDTVRERRREEAVFQRGEAIDTKKLNKEAREAEAEDKKVGDLELAKAIGPIQGIHAKVQNFDDVGLVPDPVEQQLIVEDRYEQLAEGFEEIAKGITSADGRRRFELKAEETLGKFKAGAPLLLKEQQKRKRQEEQQLQLKVGLAPPTLNTVMEVSAFREQTRAFASTIEWDSEEALKDYLRKADLAAWDSYFATKLGVPESEEAFGEAHEIMTGAYEGLGLPGEYLAEKRTMAMRILRGHVDSTFNRRSVKAGAVPIPEDGVGIGGVLRTNNEYLAALELDLEEDLAGLPKNVKDPLLTRARSGLAEARIEIGLEAAEFIRGRQLFMAGGPAGTAEQQGLKKKYLTDLFEHDVVNVPAEEAAANIARNVVQGQVFIPQYMATLSGWLHSDDVDNVVRAATVYGLIANDNEALIASHRVGETLDSAGARDGTIMLKIHDNLENGMPKNQAVAAAMSKFSSVEKVKGGAATAFAALEKMEVGNLEQIESYIVDLPGTGRPDSTPLMQEQYSELVEAYFLAGVPDIATARKAAWNTLYSQWRVDRSTTAARWMRYGPEQVYGLHSQKALRKELAAGVDLEDVVLITQPTEAGGSAETPYLYDVYKIADGEFKLAESKDGNPMAGWWPGAAPEKKDDELTAEGIHQERVAKEADTQEALKVLRGEGKKGEEPANLAPTLQEMLKRAERILGVRKDNQ